MFIAVSDNNNNLDIEKDSELYDKMKSNSKNKKKQIKLEEFNEEVFIGDES